MIWLEFGLGDFAQSFFLSLESKIFVSFMKDKNIDICVIFSLVYPAVKAQ